MYRITIAPDQLRGTQLHLNSAQQHYLRRVVRLATGDRFVALDGCGQTWLAELGATNATIIETLTGKTELPTALTLIVALPKGSGFDEIVRCCTELGVSQFMPVMGDRTLLVPSENKLKRWRRIAAEAAEQSERQIVPSILPPMPFAKAVENLPDGDRFLCVARGGTHLVGQLYQSCVNQSVAIATGPEGGWSRAEIELATHKGFKSVSLGKRILRAVTAPIAATSVVMAMLEANLNKNTGDRI